MIKKVVQTNTFKRYVKKLPKQYKLELDTEIKKIIKDPLIGDQKKGDLSFLYVHKCKINKQLTLIGYSFEKDELVLTLLQAGSHENFYRDIKP
jgi:mRNA-degrading endonuclease YafQ of YafQ-DinJ toxin-antitoxin module